MNAPVTMSPETGRVIATCFALAAFIIALLAGLAGGNDAAQILLRAVGAMVLCYVAGTVIGAICDHVIARHASANATTAEATIAAPSSPSDRIEDSMVVSEAAESAPVTRAAA